MLQEVEGQPRLLSIQESQAQPDSPLISQAGQLKGQARYGSQRKQRFQSIGAPIPHKHPQQKALLVALSGPEHVTQWTVSVWRAISLPEFSSPKGL